MRIAALTIVVLVGCGGATAKKILGTDTRDTDENRQVIETVERYRIALERQDFFAILEMASADYRQCPTPFDPPGECATLDDLEQALRDRFEGAKIAYSMRYHTVTRRSGRLVVEVTVNMRYVHGDVVHWVQRPHEITLTGYELEFASGLLPPPDDEVANRKVVDPFFAED